MIKRKEKQEQRAIPVLTKKTNFSVSEAYKATRTNLLFTLQKHKGRKILFTSAAPGEGKSTNCCNLGITLSQMHSRVLILDCDLRKPMIHKCFHRDCIPGLSDLLAGMKDDLAEVVQSTDYSNLNIVCGGTVPPNPSELLSSIAMEKLLAILSEEYDYILLDTPPVNMVSDALVLSAKADGVVLVVRKGKTTHPELSHAMASLKFANVRVLGMILNGAGSAERCGYGKNSYKKYQKYLKEYK